MTVRELHSIKDTLAERMDRMEDDLMVAMNSVRDRHHDAMNSIMSALSRQDVSLMALTGQVKSNEKAVEVLADMMRTHISEPGHKDTMEWRAALKGQMRVWAVLGALTGSILSGVTVGLVVWGLTRGF